MTTLRGSRTSSGPRPAQHTGRAWTADKRHGAARGIPFITLTALLRAVFHTLREQSLRLRTTSRFACLVSCLLSVYSASLPTNPLPR